MKSKIFLQLIILITGIIFSFPAQSAAPSMEKAQQWAQEKGQLLLSSFKIPDYQERYQKLDELFLEYVDMDYVSRFVIGKYWKDMSQDQKVRYQKLFQRYALAIYKTFPLDFAQTITYKVIGAQREGNFTIVTVKVNVQLSQEKGLEDILLQFRLKQNGSKIQLVDIKFAESSLMLVYRSKFYEMMAQDEGEVEWFLEDLEGKALSAEKINESHLSTR